MAQSAAPTLDPIPSISLSATIVVVAHLVSPAVPHAVTVDALAAAHLEPAAVVDAAVGVQASKTAAASALVGVAGSKTASAGALIGTYVSGAVSVDALIRSATSAVERGTSVDVLLGPQHALASRIDAAIAGEFTRASAVDVAVAAEKATSASAGALVGNTRAQDVLVSALVRGTQERAATLDAYIQGYGAAVGTTVDALIAAPAERSASASALVAAQRSGSVAVDALIELTRRYSAVDALVGSEASRTASLGVALAAEREKAAALDVLIWEPGTARERSVPVDALIAAPDLDIPAGKILHAATHPTELAATVHPCTVRPGMSATAYLGDDLDIEFHVVDAERNPIDITDAELYCDCRTGTADPIPCAATIVDDGPGGVFRARFTTDQTTAFVSGAAYRYDAAVKVGGRVLTPGSGGFRAIPRITPTPS